MRARAKNVAVPNFNLNLGSCDLSRTILLFVIAIIVVFHSLIVPGRGRAAHLAAFVLLVPIGDSWTVDVGFVDGATVTVATVATGKNIDALTQILIAVRPRVTDNVTFLWPTSPTGTSCRFLAQHG